MLLALLSSCLEQPQTEIALANWPHAYKAAVAISFDTESASSEQLAEIVKLLKENSASATFFVVAGYFQNGAAALEALRGYEVASLAWKQSAWSSAELTKEFQKAEMERAHSWLVSRGFNPRGFRAPYLKSNGATFEALEEMGYLYDSSQNFGSLPYKVGSVVEIPLSLNYDAYWSEPAARYSALINYLVFQKSYDSDSLFAIYTHVDKASQNFDAFSQFVRYVKVRGLWLPSSREVAEWWLAREKLELRVDGRSVIVKNYGDKAVKGATVKIKPKKSVSGAIAQREHGDALYAVLPEIPPRGEVRISIE